MAVCRVEKNKNYTTMSNYHLRDPNLSNKARGLLSTMLSLPDNWNYTTRGLARICKDGVDGITAQLKELEQYGYLVRHRIRDSGGRITDMEYIIYERPHTASPDTEKPYMVKTVKRKITDLQKMTIEEQKKAVRSGYDMDIIPSDLATYGNEAKKILQDLQSRNERMFLLTFLVLNTANTKQQLSNNVFQASSIAQKYNCQLTRLDIDFRVGCQTNV